MINNLRYVGALGAVSVAFAALGTAQAANTTPPWLEALEKRGEALNRAFGLGSQGRRELGAPGPSWLVALNARSEAMNRYYGLGQYARQAARTASSPDWLVALNARGDGLNRRYGLGDYGPTRVAGGAAKAGKGR